MGMKYCFAPVILLKISMVSSFGQGSILSFGMNYGTFAMGDPKTFQNQAQSISMPLHAKQVATFPAYWGYDGQLYFNTGQRFKIGIFGGFNSTAGRVSYSDYSGSASVDQQTQCYQVGLGSEYELANIRNGWQFFFTMRAGAIITKYDYSSILTLGGVPNQQVVKFKANSYLLSPGFAVNKKLDNSIFVSGEIRYLLDTEGKLRDSNGFNLLIHGTPRNPGSRPVYTDWSGLRIGLMIGLYLRREER